ncbi:MAG: DUF2069 domain-containing protein [Nitrosomonadales bacterium]|jgi:uncharacterized membrane protein
MMFLLNLISYFFLIFLNLLWEIFFTIDQSPSWMVVKSLILLLPLKKILSKDIYTIKWVNFLVIFFFIEGVVRAYSENGISKIFASLEILLTLLLFFSSIQFIRHENINFK